MRLSGLRPSRRVRWWLFAVLATVALGLYLWQFSPPRAIVLATAQEGGMYDAYGREYERRLGRLGLRVRIARSNGSIDNLRRLINGTADVAFVQSGTYPLVDDRRHRVRGLASLYVEPLWVFYRAAGPLDDLAKLANRAVSVGPVDSGTEAVARALLERHGAAEAGGRLVNLGAPDARGQLIDGRLDAAFFVTSYHDEGVQALLRRRDVQLLSFRHDEAYTRNFPGLTAIRIPAGLLDLRHTIPAEDITLLAPAALLVCRADLHARTVEMLLNVARAVHGPGDLLNAAQRYPSRDGVDIPLHETAERYFTSGESILSRVLPYWAIRWVFLVPLLAVWFPAVRLLPELYSWRGARMVTRHYVKLRSAEAALLRAARREDLQAAIAACEQLGREGAVLSLAHRLPLRRQRDMYDWRHHLALVLEEARERLRRMPPGSDGQHRARPDEGSAP